MATSSAPYWGNLDPPKVNRSNSMKRQSNGNGYENNDEDLVRSSSHRASQYQSNPQQQRASVQSQAQTVSTQSPFASPTASSFAGAGLAPRPSSFQYGANDPYSKEYEKRRRRASKDPDTFYNDQEDYNPPPAAPEPPKPGPPLSYKQPYNTGAGSQIPTRTTSSRRPNIAIDTRQGAAPRDFPEETSATRENRRPSDAYAALRGEKELGRSGTNRDRDRGAVRTGSVNARKVVPEAYDPAAQGRLRKASNAESEGGSRRREWAPDRSPLQRLELTLDSITKEEKRARVEEAELLARQETGQSEDRKNSVRFRNRPVGKGPERSDADPRSPQDSELARKSSTRQAEVPRQTTTSGRSASVDDPAVASKQLNEPSGSKEPPLTTRQIEKSAVPQRGASFRERAAAPAVAAATGAAVGTGLGRSTSNKLKKEPPGDPWYNKRLEAEQNYRKVSQKKSPADEADEGFLDRTAPPAVPPKDSVKGQPAETQRKQAVFHPLDMEDLDSEGDQSAPVRRGGSNKIAQLTGERNLPKTKILPQQQQLYADRLDRSEELGPNGGPDTNDRNRIDKPVHGHRFAVAPEVAAAGYAEEKATIGPDGHHHFSNIFHDRRRSQYRPGDGIYAPGKRLDEWKKAGKASLTGVLLDLDHVETQQSEADKDKAWWEAGNKGKRRPSTTKRKIDTYDGGVENPNGMVSSDIYLASTTPSPMQYQTKTWTKGIDTVVPRARQIIGFQGTSSKREKTDRRDRTWKLEEPPSEEDSDRRKPRFHISSAIFSPYSPLCPFQSEHNFLFHPFHKCPISLIERIRLTSLMRFIRVPDPIAPTSFRPPIYLKCGPLLRYCGIKKETPPSRPGGKARPEREIWRGTVMIVTSDNDSSYDVAPTLRLFAQPMERLPPPPAHVDGGLDPEYVDPLAGLPKLGRDGKTLYIRPVEELEESKDISMDETDNGLFESTRTFPGQYDGPNGKPTSDRRQRFGQDGEKLGKYVEVQGFRLHAEHGMTFWRFNLEVELGATERRVAYRINRGPPTGFWVPAKGQSMNIMFHSCNGFSLSVNSDQFSGPDPMWRDVLNTHQTQPFHVMIGGGDQVYNDRVMKDTTVFAEWLAIKNPLHKHNAPFSQDMQQELEMFYLNRYSMWFSQGLFGVANSQIPMVNIYDDHDIIDGFGSYPHHFMDSPVFTGLGAIAFKYYMLFQHQSSIDEGEDTEPSWLIGHQPGPYIKEMSRSLFMSMGQGITFLGLDCRTERSRDEIISLETMDKIFDRCTDQIVKGETKHLIVLLGVPIAYPRLVWLENILTSRLMTPVKAMGKAGMFGNLLNQFDGGVEILDDLDDHWTAKNHKRERLHLIQDLQDLAAEKSVRVTILGGDVHLAAIGQFFSNPKLGIPKDKDHRYMPNVISSAIVNTPPPEIMADVLNKRNKIHHMDHETDEDMIPIFTTDVNGSKRNNKHLLPRRNWCSIRQYNPELSPPPTPTEERSPSPPRAGLLRRFSSSRGPSYRAEAAGPPPPRTGLLRRFSLTGRRPSLEDDNGRRHSMEDRSRPPVALNQNMAQKPKRSLSLTRAFKPGGLFHRDSSKRRADAGGINGYGDESDEEYTDDERYDEPQNFAPRMRGGAGSPSYFPEDDYYEEPPARTRSKLTKGKEPVRHRNMDRSGDRYDRAEAEARYEQSPRAAPTAPAIHNPSQHGDSRHTSHQASIDRDDPPQARRPFHRTPTGMSIGEKKHKQNQGHEVNLEGGLDICLNVEVNQKDPAGITVPYRLLVPALWYREGEYGEKLPRKEPTGLKRFVSFGRKTSNATPKGSGQGTPQGRQAERDTESRSGSERGSFSEGDDGGQIGQRDPVDMRRQGKGFLAGRF